MLTAELKESLEKQLRAEHERLHVELIREPQPILDDRPGYTNHMADGATEVFEQAKNLALRQALQQELEMVELALAKLEKGTLGVCDRCGQLIDVARLEALPQARFCLSCQRYLEELHPYG